MRGGWNALFATLLLLGSCGRGPANVSNEKADPVYGDTYVDSSIGDASMLNPVLMADSASGAIINLVFDGLIRYGKDLQLEPELASSWEIKQGGLEIVFHLRKDVLWHDGVPFTAADVLFTYQRLTDPKSQTPFSDDYQDIKSVTTPDPYTVRVIYKDVFAPGLASWGIGILPKHVYEKGDFNTHPANRKPIGTGPFVFKEWRTDQYIMLEANPHYFRGRPKIQRYIYRVIPDQSVQFLEMRNQSIDSLELTPDQYKAYDKIFENHQRFRYPSFKYIYLGFNMRDPHFRDKRIRQAIAYALDKETLVRGLVLGFGQPITGPFPLTSWAYNHEARGYPYDLKKALELLAEAGWTLNSDHQLVDKQGTPFRFTLMTNQGNKIRALAVEVIQQQLKMIGIQVDIRIIEWSTFNKRYIDKKDFEAIVLGWQLTRDPDAYGIWHSSQQKEGQYNFCSYSNPEVDRLLVEGRRTFDKAKRQVIYHKIHQLIAEDVPYVFLYCPDQLDAVHRRFRGPQVSAVGLGWNFNEWYVPPNERRYRTAITQ